MNFLEQLEKSKTLKVKFKGKFYPVPPPILRQAKKFALESVGIDYLVFKNNPSSEIGKEKQVKKAFGQFLESYYEAIVPETGKNPSAKKAKAAFKSITALADPEDNATSMFNKWFEKETMSERKSRFGSFKGSVMQLAHLYTEAVGHIPKSKQGHSTAIGADNKQIEQNEVRANQFFRATIAAIIVNLMNKLYQTDPKRLQSLLYAKIPPNELEKFFKNEDDKKVFFANIKIFADRELNKLNFLSFLED